MAKPILVVDDDRSILGLVSELLEDAGYDVTSTSDPVEGMRLVLTLQPGVIVLDMRMPVLDGWQFKQSLDDRGLEIPVIVMTAAQDARRVANEIHAAGYVAKPFDIDEMLRVVARVMPPPPSPATRESLFSFAPRRLRRPLLGHYIRGATA